MPTAIRPPVMPLPRVAEARVLRENAPAAGEPTLPAAARPPAEPPPGGAAAALSLAMPVDSAGWAEACRLADPQGGRLGQSPLLEQRLQQSAAPRTLGRAGISREVWDQIGRPVLPDMDAFWSVIDDPEATPPSSFGTADEARVGEELIAFRASLSASDRAQWDLGRRLSDGARAKALAGLTPAEAAARQFSDDDVHAVAINPKLDATAAAAAAAVGETSWHWRRILMDAWWVLSPIDTDWLVDGLRFGFTAAIASSLRPGLVSLKKRNHPSAVADLAKLHGHVDKLAAKGTLVGPLDVCPFLDATISPLGLVPKGESDTRMIQDCTFTGVNEASEPSHSVFLRVDEIMAEFTRAGHGAYAIGGDKSGAYTSVPRRPCDFPLSVIHVPGRGYYWSPVFCFGEATSSARWEPVGALLTKLLLGVWHGSRFLRFVDDIRARIRGAREGAVVMYALLAVAAARYGWTMGALKWDAPSTLDKFYGFLFNSMEMTVSMTERKVVRYSRGFQSLVDKTLWSLKEFRSVVGRMQYVCCLWRSMRPMLRIVFAAKAVAERRLVGSQRCIDPKFCHPHMRDRVRFWLKALQVHTGTWHLHQYRDSDGLAAEDCVEMTVDASATDGFGFYCVTSGGWACRAWTARERQLHVRGPSGLAPSSALFEGVGLIYSIYTCVDQLKRKAVTIHIDNLPLVLGLKSRTSNLPHMQSVIDMVSLFELRYQCRIIPVHISTTDNFVSDKLSHQDIPAFRVACAVRGWRPACQPMTLSAASSILIWPRRCDIF
jgi:hypothetical protein